MAGGWRTATVAELQQEGVLLVEDGNHGEYRPRPDEFVNEGVAFIRAADMDNGRVLFHSASKISARARERITKGIGASGDVLLSHKGTVGKVALVPNDAPSFVCSPQTTFWRTRDPQVLDRKYLHAFLRSPSFHRQLATRAGETDMAPYVSLTSQRGLYVTLPPIDIQRKIAHILGTLDDKIELNRRTSETLEAMARAIFKSWFVDFDPVRAKAQNRDTGLPKPIADLFPDSFEGSELGEIPKGWKVRRLADVCSTQYGYTASACDDPVGPHFLRVMDINKTNWIDWHAVPYCEIPPEQLAKYTLGLGDIVVARMADPGKCAIIEEEVNAVFASYLVRLKADTLADSYYIYGFLKSALYSEYAEGAKSGSVQANMNAQVIVGAELVWPSEVCRKNHFAAVRPLRQRIVSNVRESATLSRLRDALLPKLLSGEIRVGEARRVFEDRP